MLKYEPTVNVLICKEGASCCPLIRDITLHYHKTFVALNFLISGLDVLCLHCAFLKIEIVKWNMISLFVVVIIF